MSQLADHEIIHLCTANPSDLGRQRPMIDPFLSNQVKRIFLHRHADAPEGAAVRAISFGTSSYGYDVRLSPKNFKLFRMANKDYATEWNQERQVWFPHSSMTPPTPYGKDCFVADPKNLNPALLQELEPITDDTGTYFIVPSHGYCLAETIEYFDLPRNIMMTSLGKSTNVRTGISANVTPGEPAWHGKITLELGNWLPVPVKMYAHEGIAQFIFWKGDKEPDICYSDREDPKYQGQTGTTLPKV